MLQGVAPLKLDLDLYKRPTLIQSLVGNAVLDVIEAENLLERVSKVEQVLINGLVELKGQFENLGAIRGKGLLLGIEVIKPESGQPDPETALNIEVRLFAR